MTTLKTHKKSNKSALFWFESTEELKSLGFTETEIKKAIKQAGATAESLTSFEYVEADTDNYYSNSENFELVAENTTWSFEEEKIIKGEVFTRRYEARANEYRTRGNYQSTQHEPILRNLLENKFPYLKNFKLDIFSLSGEGKNWEIYAKINKQSLYIPVRALFEKDPQIIIDRMTSYHNDFRSQRDPTVKTHNHKENEHQQTNGGCPLCQEIFYQESMKPLKSVIAKRLLEAISQ